MTSLRSKVTWLLNAVLAVLLVYSSALGASFYAKLRNGDVLLAQTVPYQRIEQSPQRVLILGDSLAYGMGASSPYTSFAGQIANLYPEKDIINKATIGNDTQELADTISELTNDTYNEIHILIGGNDIARYGIDLNQTKENFLSIAASTSDKADHIFIYTTVDFANVSIIPAFLRFYYSDRSLRVQGYAQSAADKHANTTYVDAFTIDKDTYKLYEASDGFHLNDKGVEALVSRLKSYL